MWGLNHTHTNEGFRVNFHAEVTLGHCRVDP